MKLTSKQRKRLPQSEYALPGKRYPIPDKSHARDALARASEEYANGKLSASELKEIQVKAHAKLRGRRV